jgi:hypothetical protein
MYITHESRTANSGFVQAGMTCFVDSLVVNYNFVLRMKFSAKTPRHRKLPKRQVQVCSTTNKSPTNKKSAIKNN